MSRNQTDIITAFDDFFRVRQPSLELTEGTPEHDLFIRAPAIEFEKFYNRAFQISMEQSLETASDEGIDILASNFSTLRKGPTSARVTLRVFRRTVPTTTVEIPVGTVVSTIPNKGAVSVQFRTTESVVMYASLAASYLNTVTGLYELTVHAESIVPGRDGIVGANTITSFVTPITGIDGVYNAVASSGGMDRESTLSLAVRLSRSLAGSNLGTSDGYLLLMVSQDGVEDALVVGNGDSLRDQLGAVDIYVKGKKSASFTDTFVIVQGTVAFNLTPAKQPIIIDGAATLTDSVLGVLTPVTGWEFVRDVSIVGGSIKAEDVCRVLATYPTPGNISTLVLTYEYNQLIEELQATINKSYNHIHNSNVLVLWAKEIAINISLNIKVLTDKGFAFSDVQTAVNDAVTSFLSDYKIAQEVQQADIARVILNTPGVDDVQLPFTTFQSSDGTVTRNSFGNLTIPIRSYATAGTITITPIP